MASYNPKAPLISLTQGHLTAGFPKVINVGYGAIKKQADDWLDAHEGNLMGEDVEKAIFYRAASISCQAAITMVSRYAQAVREALAACDDPERAKELLRDQNYSVRQAGVEVGMQDPYHFSKQFKNIVGISPSAFMKQASAPNATIRGVARKEKK